jgi:hypothetical protein
MQQAGMCAPAGALHLQLQLRAVLVVGCRWLRHPGLFLGAVPGCPTVVELAGCHRLDRPWSWYKPVAGQQPFWCGYGGRMAAPVGALGAVWSGPAASAL